MNSRFEEISKILCSRSVSEEPIQIDVPGFDLSETFRPQGFELSNFSFNAISNVDGEDIIGCGEDVYSAELAKAKAVSEITERLVLKTVSKKLSTSISSNGWAAHLSLEQAAVAALLELIERDSALMHWYSKTAMLSLNPESILPQSFLSGLLATELPKIVILISFDFSGPLATVLLMNHQGNAISGHASGLSLESSIISAAIEACRAAHHYQRFNYYEETKRLLNNELLGKVDPGAHNLMYAYHAQIPSWIFGGEIDKDAALAAWDLKLAELLTVAKQCSISTFRANDRIVARVQNESLQQAFWGSTQYAFEGRRINLSRINETQILNNTRPHMVG